MRKLAALLLVVLLLGSLATVAFAEDDPSKTIDPKYKVEIIYDFEVPEDGGTYTVKENEEFVFSPKEKDGYTFDRYEIEGEYELVSKDGNTWTIIPKSDLIIHVKYKGVTPEPKPTDDKPVSPGTGVNTVLIAAVILVGLCGVVLAGKKLAKNH